MGNERDLLYKTALETGLRAGECRSLKVGSFDFDENTVAVHPSYVKNKKPVLQPMQSSTAGELQAFFAGKMPNCKAFNMPHENKVVLMLKEDLAEAGVAYEIGGKFADFHSTRHTFVSSVVRSGATIKEVQTLARHSKAEMTIGIYSHVGINDTRKVIDRMQTVEAEAVKTGTDSSPQLVQNGRNSQLHLPVTCLNSAQHQISADNHRRKGGKIQGQPEHQKPAITSEKRGFPGKNEAKTERPGFEPGERVKPTRRFSKPLP